VPADIAGDLATAGRMSHQHHVVQVECLDDGPEVIGVRVEVVAVPRLRRATTATPIVSDAPEPLSATTFIASSQASAVKRPAVAEQDGWPRPQSLKKISLLSFVETWPVVTRIPPLASRCERSPTGQGYAGGSRGSADRGIP
jgi:hypothetical protein